MSAIEKYVVIRDYAPFNELASLAPSVLVLLDSKTFVKETTETLQFKVETVLSNQDIHVSRQLVTSYYEFSELNLGMLNFLVWVKMSNTSNADELSKFKSIVKRHLTNFLNTQKIV